MFKHAKYEETEETLTTKKEHEERKSQFPNMNKTLFTKSFKQGKKKVSYIKLLNQSQLMIDLKISLGSEI